MAITILNRIKPCRTVAITILNRIKPCRTVAITILNRIKPCRTVANTTDVPGHVEEQLQLVGGHLRVVDIGNPQPAAVMVVGGAHLFINEAGLRGAEPEVVVRSTPVAQVVIHASAAFSLLLLGIGQSRQVAVIVVAPHQRHVVGHAQPALHNLQHLLIGDEDLRHLLYMLLIKLSYQLPLVVDDLLQCPELLLWARHPLHRAVVDAPHAQGE